MRRNAKDILDRVLSSLDWATLVWMSAAAVGGMIFIRWIDRRMAAGAMGPVAAQTPPASIPTMAPPPSAPASPPAEDF